MHLSSYHCRIIEMKSTKSPQLDDMSSRLDILENKFESINT